MIQTIADALAEKGYDTLTPVQEAVTNPELADADLLVSAQTGSGKTVGFGLAIAETLLGGQEQFAQAGKPLALIVAPTRELAMQVKRELGWLYGKAGAVVASCVGGMDMRDERRSLDRGAHIVVGTPGRLRDHIQRGSMDMSALRAIVLDEADEMLDLGFREDLEFMLAEAPDDRRTLMFSATVPASIAKLAQSYQRDAVRVQTQTKGGQHADISYRALSVAAHDTENAIINLLRFHDAENAIVFANTRATVARLTARFANRGFAVVSLSGELSQAERSHALQAMRDGRAKVCVATDVAARGIDLPNLELVVHAELPMNAEGLLHRSGRTGRAGRKGISALIVPHKLARKAERLLATAKVKAVWELPPSADDILLRDQERLLQDPSWDEEITPEQASFAEKLLAERDPALIAAAYLRLYQSHHSAPEDLASPDSAPVARRDSAPREPFGPSAWVSLSVGRSGRAEARWLLPMLCKAGGMSKDDIGAIRIQEAETFVEIKQAAVKVFLGNLGPAMKLENDVVVTALDKAPDLSGPTRRAPRDERSEDAPRKSFDRPERTERPARAPRAEAEQTAVEAPVSEAPVKPRHNAAERAAAKAARDADLPPVQTAPAAKKVWEKRTPSGKSGADKPYGKKPWQSKDGDSAQGDRKPYARDGAGKPGGGKPWEKRDAAGGKDKKPFGKPSGKPGGKPFAKPEGKSFGKPKASASDTSKRFTPPGGKPGPRANRAPGGGTPKRGKS